MRKGTGTPLLALGLPLVLAACGQSPVAGTPDPYANGVSYPWSYVAPEGQLTAQRLTPGDNNLSFEAILAARNSWGPVEINRSNGERQAGDGNTLTLNGRTYDRGFGTHAGSELRFSLGGTNGARCTRFTADVGVDDEVGGKGSVAFQVFLDNVKVYDSGKMTGASATKKVDLDIRAKGELRLIVTDAGDGISYDHADWASPKIVCQTSQFSYPLTLNPNTVSAGDGSTVTVKLTVSPDESGQSGPVSFWLRSYGPTGEITPAEPDRLYTASSLPATFDVKLRLKRKQDDQETAVKGELVAQYEGYDQPDSTRRSLVTWNVERAGAPRQGPFDNATCARPGSTPLLLSAFNPNPFGGSFTTQTPAFSASFNKAIGQADSSSFVVQASQTGRPFLDGQDRILGLGSGSLYTGNGSFLAGQEVEVSPTQAPRAQDGSALCRPVVFRYRVRTEPEGAPGFGGLPLFNAATYGVGARPAAVGTGDLNGDGRPDLVTVNTSENSISVLLGRADGTFAPRVDFPVGVDPRGLTQADFNRDGKLDVATANSGSSNVSVLLGNGDGTFAPRNDFTVGIGTTQHPTSITAGDFNRDGQPDLAVSAQGRSDITGNAEHHHTVAVLVNDNDANFFRELGRNGKRLEYDVEADPVAIVAADLNRDGQLDLATANSGDSSISVLLGSGDATFQGARRYFATTDPQDVTAADVDGDGAPELFTANRGQNSVSMLVNNGDGQFFGKRDDGVGQRPTAVSLADLDGDGRLDLLAANSVFAYDHAAQRQIGSVTLRVRQGDGNLRPGRQYGVGARPSAVAAADTNADGKLDIITSNQDSNDVSVLQAGVSGGSSTTGVAVGDLNNDFSLDVVAISGNGIFSANGTVSVLLGNATGAFYRRDYVVGGSLGAVALRDVNMDRKLDIVVTKFSASAVSVLLGNGDGTFQSAIETRTGSSPNGLTAADLNGDGKPDLVTAGSDGVSVLLGKADGTFDPAVNYGAGLRTSSVTAGDANNDGVLDLMVGGHNALSVLLGSGDGTFQAAVAYHTAGGNMAPVMAGDLGGDGKLDLVTASPDLGNVLVLPGKGDGTFGPLVRYGSGPNPFSVVLGDFNGDGRLDVAAANAGAGNGFGSVSVLSGNADGTLAPKVDYGTAGHSAAFAAGDVNFDHKLDLVTADFLSGAVSVLLKN